MKIRQGFVSNSSSSSFIILGVKYKRREEDDLCKIWNWHEGNMRALTNDDVYYKGFVLGKSDCDYMESQAYTRYELGELARQVQKVLGCKIDDVQIHIGTRSC